MVHIHAEGPAFFAWLPKMFGKRVVVNQINKNDLRWNKINRTKEAYGRYQNVFLENYSELKIEIAELLKTLLA